MSTPASRSLEFVLRRALAPVGQLRVLVGTYGTASSDPRYANVVIDGQTFVVPNLNGASAGAPGTVAYVLADHGRMWLLGTVTSTAPPTPGAPTFIAKAGPPSAADGTDGAVYLDLTSLRFWGPKASGAWPAAAFARVMPLNPTYAQLRSG